MESVRDAILDFVRQFLRQVYVSVGADYRVDIYADFTDRVFCEDRRTTTDETRGGHKEFFDEAAPIGNASTQVRVKNLPMLEIDYRVYEPGRLRFVSENDGMDAAPSHALFTVPMLLREDVGNIVRAVRIGFGEPDGEMFMLRFGALQADEIGEKVPTSFIWPLFVKPVSVYQTGRNIVRIFANGSDESGAVAHGGIVERPYRNGPKSMSKR